MGIKELNWKNKAVPNDRKYMEPFPTTVCLFSPFLLRTALLCSCSMLEEWWLLHVRLGWAADMVPGEAVTDSTIPTFMETLLLCIRDAFKRPSHECPRTVNITQQHGLGPAGTSQMLLHKISSKPQQLSVLLCCLAPGTAGLWKC